MSEKINHPETNHHSTLTIDANMENFLRKQFQQNHEYKEDNGFTEQLMKKLPTQKIPAWKTNSILVLPCLIVSLLVAQQFHFVSLYQYTNAWLHKLTIMDGLMITAFFCSVMIGSVLLWFTKQTRWW